MVSGYPKDASMILTLWLDEETQATLDRLRERYFPPERNFIPAHVTLFHSLPEGLRAEIETRLTQVAGRTRSLPFLTAQAMSLGRGAALRAECPGLAELRKDLAAGWQDWLTPQDRQPHRPHVTVQNKVDPKVARQTLAELSALPAVGGTARGLALWRYLGGPWEEIGRYPFGGIE